MKSFYNENVAEILRKYPETRNSDRLLTIKYLQEFTCENETEKKLVEKLFNKCDLNLGTIIRRRAYIQNDMWMYKATERVRENRAKLQAEYGIDYKLVKYFGRFKNFIWLK